MKRFGTRPKLLKTQFRGVPKNSNVVPFLAVYYNPYKQKIGHNQKGTTLEPVGKVADVSGRSPQGPFESSFKVLQVANSTWSCAL